MVETELLKSEGFAMAIFILLAIIVVGLVIYMVASLRGIQKSRSEVEKLFK